MSFIASFALFGAGGSQIDMPFWALNPGPKKNYDYCKRESNLSSSFSIFSRHTLISPFSLCRSHLIHLSLSLLSLSLIPSTLVLICARSLFVAKWSIRVGICLCSSAPPARSRAMRSLSLRRAHSLPLLREQLFRSLTSTSGTSALFHFAIQEKAFSRTSIASAPVRRLGYVTDRSTFRPTVDHPEKPVTAKPK
jgi:hypothetical protein